MQTLNDYVWVFVGCGGTFYAASPYLAVLARRYCKHPLLIFDPDIMEEGNHDRQWPSWPVGGDKVTAAMVALGHSEGTEIASTFRESDPLLSEATDGRPVLVIVNVDNNQTRLEIADWLESRISPGIMIVSGCERTFGQCYPGIWMDGEAIYDWRLNHPDVQEDTTILPIRPCNRQTIRANALTGTLVGLCIEDVAKRLEESDLSTAMEFYWRGGDHTLRVWNQVVECREVSVYG